MRKSERGREMKGREREGEEGGEETYVPLLYLAKVLTQAEPLSDMRLVTTTRSQ